MDCVTAREAISALLDGEDSGTRPEDVDAHLAGCGECRTWRDAAQEVTRRARLRAAAPGPAPTGAVMAAVRAQARPARHPGAAALTRVVLVLVAGAQLGFVVPCLLFGHDHSAPEHVAHEMGALGAALAAGFLVAAWRPCRAVGMRALLGVAAVLLMVTAAADLATGHTSLADEAPHLLAVAGWLLVRYLAAVTPPLAGDPYPAPLRTMRSWLHMAPGPRRGLSRTTRTGPAHAGPAPWPTTASPASMPSR